MKLKSTKFIALAFASILSVGALVASPAFADPTVNCSDDNIPAAVREAAGCGSTSNDQLPNAVIVIINAIIAVSGIIAVIYIIIGGVQYMTSSGDAGKIKKAKDTILYAVIGLIICVLAFAIVNFVITKALS